MTINFLNIIQVLVAIALIGFILVQRGPGATAGSAFGSGASGTVFGAKGSSSFLSKGTAVLATLFFIITMAISIDFRDRYGVTEESTGQDLGVMGQLDNQERPDALIPSESEAGNEGLPVNQNEESGDEANSSPLSSEEPGEATVNQPDSQPIDDNQGGDQ